MEAPVIRLGKASTLRVKVVDRAGKPVAGAYLQVGTWRGRDSLLRIGAQSEVPWRSTWNAQTDAEGRFTWTSTRATPCSSISSKMGICARNPYP